MFEFKDNFDQDWKVELDLGKLHQMTNGGIDFTGVTDEAFSLINPDEKTLEQIRFQPMIAIPIVFFCVKDDFGDKANSKGEKLSQSPQADIDFYSLFSPETTEEVTIKLLFEITSFFPLLETITPKLIETFSQLKETAAEVLEKNELMTKAQMEEMIKKGITDMQKDVMTSGS